MELIINVLFKNASWALEETGLVNEENRSSFNCFFFQFFENAIVSFILGWDRVKK